MTDDRTLRQLLEDTQSQLKQAQAKVEDLEARRRLADLHAQTETERAQKLEQDLVNVSAQLASAQQANLGEQMALLQGQLATLQQRLAQLDQELPPRSARPDICSHCGATKIAWIGRIDGGGHEAVALTVNRKPGDFFGRGLETFDLFCRVCGSCGRVDVLARDQERLYDAYLDKLKNAKKAEPPAP